MWLLFKIIFNNYLVFIIIKFKLILNARKIKTKMSEEGEKLLRQYFIVLRRLIPEKMSIHILPLL